MKKVFYFLRLSLTLMLVCGIAAGALAATYSVTQPVVEEQEKRETIEKYKDVLKIFEVQGIAPVENVEALKNGKEVVEGLEAVFDIVKGTEKIGVAITTGANGYGGLVKVAVAIKADGAIAGIKILDISGETKGVGDKVVEEPGFIKQFIGKTVNDPLKISTDIDAISGASITSRAVTQDVSDAAKIFKEFAGGS
ncbi:MAG TPA: FMN-binding protein [Actinobacteria bacterium]|nr:FMN-binding protein [Actinomycetota bacterium]